MMTMIIMTMTIMTIIIMMMTTIMTIIMMMMSLHGINVKNVQEKEFMNLPVLRAMLNTIVQSIMTK